MAGGAWWAPKSPEAARCMSRVHAASRRARPDAASVSCLRPCHHPQPRAPLAPCPAGPHAQCTGAASAASAHRPSGITFVCCIYIYIQAICACCAAQAAPASCACATTRRTPAAWSGRRGEEASSGGRAAAGAWVQQGGRGSGQLALGGPPTTVQRSDQGGPASLDPGAARHATVGAQEQAGVARHWGCAGGGGERAGATCHWIQGHASKPRLSIFMIVINKKRRHCGSTVYLICLYYNYASEQGLPATGG
jgi:hypothetical protein